MDILQQMDVDESFRLFVVQSMEELEEVESLLLSASHVSELEKSEIVNRLFRIVHTIKGSSSFFEMREFSLCAHLFENVLGMLRTGHLSFDEELLELSLSCKDIMIEVLSGSIREDSQEVQSLLSRLDIFAGLSSSDDQDIANINRKGLVSIGLPGMPALWTVSEALLVDAQHSARGGRYIFLVLYDLYYDIEKKGKTPLEVVADYDMIAKCIETKVDFATVGDLEDGFEMRLPFYILCSTSMDPAVMAEMAGVSSDNITLLWSEFISSPLYRERALDKKDFELETSVMADLRESSLSIYLPYDLVEAAKRDELRASDIFYDSISSMAASSISVWGDRLAKISGREARVSVSFSEECLVSNFAILYQDYFCEMLRESITGFYCRAEDRRQVGKSSAINISLYGKVDSGKLLFIYEDDGAGLDLNRLIKEAVSRGIVEEQRLLSHRQADLYQLFLHPEISTLGRFRERIENLKGSLTVDSRVGRGLSYLLTLPLSHH